MKKNAHSTSSLLKSAVFAGSLAAAFLTVSISDEPEAHAQTAPAGTGATVSPTAKGIIGGGLLGAEVVMFTEAVIGVKPWWAYLIGGVVGGGGGAAAGYAIEKSSTDGRAPIFLLAGGLALVIPTMVLVLNATRYHPVEGASEDAAPRNEPKADPGAPGGNAVTPGGAPVPAVPTPPPAAPAPAPAAPPPQSFLDVHGGEMRLGVPVPEVRPVFSQADRAQFGMKQQTEVRLPVFRLAF